MKDIRWYEWLYACTEDWRVWSYPKTSTKNGWVCHDGKFLIPGLGTYYQVILCKNGVCKHFKLHRLIAITLIPNPHNYPVVRHLDNNKLNNHVSNLKWGTQRDNMQQMHDDGLWIVTKKMMETFRKNWLSTGKSIMQLTKDGILCKIYNSCSEAARENGLHIENISACALWKQNTCWWFIWKYNKHCTRFVKSKI